MVVKSRFALQQAALSKPAPPDDPKPAPSVKIKPPSPSRPRGRPKTRLSTLDEIADYLYVSRSTVYRLIDTKQMPHLRIGYVLRFDLAAVLKWAGSFTESGDQLVWEDDQPELKRAR